MSSPLTHRLSSAQQVALVALRTIIGWHFLYEGYFKLMAPAWSADGVPLGPWTSAGYLKSATGPVAWLLQRLLDAGWTGWIDNTVKVSLLLVGLSLMLGLFTRLGCWGAIFLLAMFYIVSVPLAGVQQAGAEGAYLIVNKTLIEGLAVVVLLVFRTGEIAGLDLWLRDWRMRRAARSENVPATVAAQSPTDATTVVKAARE